MEKKSFSDKHPMVTVILGLFVILLIVGAITVAIIYSIKFIGYSLEKLSKLDAVVIVALITGGVSITGVVISSIIGKRLEYKKARQEYLAQKREEPYGQFVELVYKVQQNTKNPGTYTEEEMIQDISKFSKQLTLWGSPKVAKSWKEFRYNDAKSDASYDNLFVMENVMNEMRKDLGVKKLKKGGLLSFFVNDIDNYID